MYNYPKRPIKSFQDLEVYQKALAVSVAVVKRITNNNVIAIPSAVEGEAIPTELQNPNGIAALPSVARNDINNIAAKLRECVLSLPILIAKAHSLRFSDQEKAISNLEEAMLGCNLAIVYLEQYRDIYNQDLETEFFEEQIKTLLSSRIKIMHLQMSWKKFNQMPK